MKALVTGGGGFLGRAIVQRLRERGDNVRTFQRGRYADLESSGIECFRGDLSDVDSLARAIEGCEVVFHVAAKVGVWGKYREFYNTNVVGTRHVLELCERYHVAKLVYTSSPSVVFTGHDDGGMDESAPYPLYYLSPYPQTKAHAEQVVLAANSQQLATVALRPHLIWGPGDPHLLPRLIKRAKAGRLRLVGDGRNLVDSTYIDNAAAAHLLAADHLTPGAPCAGRVYFVTNGEPLPIGELLGKMLRAASLPSLVPSVAPRVAYLLGAVLESLHWLLRLSEEPLVTRFVARELATAHWFDIGAARKDLGYEPAISIDEGMDRLARSLSCSAYVAS
jgi:nucleoside-diphosphate-sugar epimerase